MTLLGGRYVRWHVPIPNIPPLKKCFTPIKGEHGPLCILAIPVRVVQPGFVNGGPKQGREVTERGGGCGRGVLGGGMKTIFLAH